MEILNTKQKVIILVVIIIIVLIIGLYIIQKTNDKYYEIPQLEEQDEVEEIKEENKKEESKKIILHISGEVNEGGVIELESGARIINAIEEAGGVTEEADLSDVNLAYELQDGQKIYIPKKGEHKDTYIIEENSEEIVKETKSTKEQLVNINTASQTELETVSGIGPSTALKIIKYRTENGKFNKIEEIKNVAGIGDAKFENIKEQICVR